MTLLQVSDCTPMSEIMDAVAPPAVEPPKRRGRPFGSKNKKSI